MILKRKLLTYSVLIIFIIGMASTNTLSINKTEINKKITLNSNQNSVSGEFKIIIVNQNALYSSNHIDYIVDYININLESQFPLINFNISIIDNVSITLSSRVIELLNYSNIKYAAIIGPIGNNNGNLFNNLFNWSEGLFLDHIENLALIDTKNYGLNTNQLSNINFISFDMLQAGFMSGIKSAILTESNKVGILLDYSTVVSFENRFYSDIYLDNEIFVTGFLSGIKYASEHLLDRREILLKTEIFDLTKDSDSELTNKLTSFKEFGADFVFNLQSYFDDKFILKAKELDLKTGVLGDNNTDASFSFVKNTALPLKDLIDHWNSTSGENSSLNFQYNLANNSYMSLSNYDFQDDYSLLLVQHLVLNGSITLSPFIDFGNQDIIPGFESSFLFVLLPIYYFRRKKINKR